MPYLKIILLTFFIFITPAIAQEKMAYTPEPLSIITESPYAYATLPGSLTGAAFMTITNNGKEQDKLIDVRSDVAEITEIHENFIDPDDGTMMMRKIKDITVPAEDSVTLEPHGLHIMFIKLKEPLTLNTTFEIKLIFEKLGEIPVLVSIVPPGRKIEKKVKDVSDSFNLNDLYDPLGSAKKENNN